MYVSLCLSAGLIEGYSSEREQMDQRIQELEEQKETMVLELETMRNKLHDLSTVKEENEKLQREMKEQQSLITQNVGEEAQGAHRYQFILWPLGVVLGCYMLHRVMYDDS